MKRPRKPLRKLSLKREREVALYAKVKREFLEKNVFCAKCCDWIAPKYRDLHHRRGRNNNLLCWTPGFLMLCRKCHNWVHHHVKEAERLGLIVRPKEWGRMPK